MTIQLYFHSPTTTPGPTPWRLRISDIPEGLQPPSYVSGGIHGCVNPKMGPFVLLELRRERVTEVIFEGRDADDIWSRVMQRLSWWPESVLESLRVAVIAFWTAQQGDGVCLCASCQRAVDGPQF